MTYLHTCVLLTPPHSTPDTIRLVVDTVLFLQYMRLRSTPQTLPVTSSMFHLNVFLYCPEFRPWGMNSSDTRVQYLNTTVFLGDSWGNLGGGKVMYQYSKKDMGYYSSIFWEGIQPVSHLFKTWYSRTVHLYCEFTSSFPIEVIDDCLVLFTVILSLLWQHFLKTQITNKKNRWSIFGKTKKLKFY